MPHFGSVPTPGAARQVDDRLLQCSILIGRTIFPCAFSWPLWPLRRPTWPDKFFYWYFSVETIS